jgi:hypothetical protein
MPFLLAFTLFHGRLHFMPFPLGKLTIVDWIQIFSAMGQCLSAVGAFLAARYALQSVREMKKQSNVAKQDYDLTVENFISSKGPRFQVKWSDDHMTLPPDSNHIFPLDSKSVSLLRDNGANYKTAFESMSLWWDNPAELPVPTKYVVLNIYNEQTESSGMAHSVKGIIHIEIKKHRKGHPPHQVFELEFKIERCNPRNTVKIPICVAGMPYYWFKLESFEYKCNHSEKIFTYFSGEQECVYDGQSRSGGMV